MSFLKGISRTRSLALVAAFATTSAQQIWASPQKPEVAVLQTLNATLAETENNGGSAESKAFFESLLAERFAFRRASGVVVGRRVFGGEREDLAKWWYPRSRARARAYRGSEGRERF
jgi:hypothetical protein